MAKKTDMTFENAMEKLEEALARLESGTLSLDESIAEFEAAVGLVKLCEDKLSVAKQKVKILTTANDGTVTDEPFIPVSDDET